MKRIFLPALLVVTSLALFLAAPAAPVDATTKAWANFTEKTLTKGGYSRVLGYTTDALAPDVIDTAIAEIFDADWVSTGNGVMNLNVIITQTSTTGSPTGATTDLDSTNTAYDISSDGTNWLQVFAIGDQTNGASGAHPVVKTIVLTPRGRYLRIRTLNDMPDTTRAVAVTIEYGRKPSSNR